MLLDVESYELLDRRDAIEGVQEEPLVLQCPPPRLDHRVREAQLGHGENTAKKTGFDQLVDVPVHILYPTISKDGRRSIPWRHARPAGFQENGHGVPRVEAAPDTP